jgi:uncharacterized protein YndB with AHSA1/START domain
MKKTEPLWVHLEIPISTSKENIWSALTLPDHTKKYMFNSALKCSWVIGSEVEWIETFDDYTKKIHVHGTLIEYKPYRSLRFAISHHRIGLGEIQSELQFLITPASEGNLLTLRQGDFSAFPAATETYLACKKGWLQEESKLKEACLSIDKKNNPKKPTYDLCISNNNCVALSSFF